MKPTPITLTPSQMETIEFEARATLGPHRHNSRYSYDDAIQDAYVHILEHGKNTPNFYRQGARWGVYNALREYNKHPVCLSESLLWSTLDAPTGKTTRWKQFDNIENADLLKGLINASSLTANEHAAIQAQLESRSLSNEAKRRNLSPQSVCLHFKSAIAKLRRTAHRYQFLEIL